MGKLWSGLKKFGGFLWRNKTKLGTALVAAGGAAAATNHAGWAEALGTAGQVLSNPDGMNGGWIAIAGALLAVAGKAPSDAEVRRTQEEAAAQVAAAGSGPVGAGR